MYGSSGAAERSAKLHGIAQIVVGVGLGYCLRGRRSLSIAGASVLAKVHRDGLMTRADEQWPGYGFAGHKGYGSAAHVDALLERGPCPLHRRSFCGRWIKGGTPRDRGSAG